MIKVLFKLALIMVTISVCTIACTVTKKVKDGEMAYTLKQYAVAIPMLESEYEEAKSKAIKGRKAYLLAKSNDQLLRHDQAIPWYKKALKNNYSDQAEEWLADAYMRNEQYSAANELFLKVCKRTNQMRYCQKAELCKQAVLAQNKETGYALRSYSGNSPQSDYSPVFFGEEYLVFTSDREESTGDDRYNWTGQSFSDLFVTTLQGRKVNNFDAIINTKHNEGTACFSQDLNEIYFTRCASIDMRDEHCRIYFSQRPNGFWMEPEALMFFSEGTNFAHPCLIENDSILVFSAAPAGGDGTYDLYYSQRVEGGWSSPELMPSSLNTEGQEHFPTSYKDTLYFSSDYLPGYGGLDIFKTFLRSDNSWSPPVNMGFPLNSGGDDFGLAVDPSGYKDASIELSGYMSSSRNVGQGDDIFYFSKRAMIKDEEPEPTEDNTENVSYTVYLAARVVELQHKDNDPNLQVIGRAALPNAQVNIKGLNASSKDAKEGSFTTDKKGFILNEVAPDLNYEITASAEGYLTQQLLFDTDFNGLLTKDTTINIELALDKIIYDKEIVLSNIYYDFDQWEIRDEAKPTLDSLKKILDLNPKMSIQLSSHTDCRGEVEYNENLSQKRAESAINYLQTQGIPSARLMAKGYGEAIPEDPCTCDLCTEAQHQVNRRTTFKILKK